MRFLRVGWEDVVSMCANLSAQIRKYKPDTIVALSRGGLVPGRILSDFLGMRDIAVVKINLSEKIGGATGFPIITQPLTADVSGKRVIVVDDVADTSRSIQVGCDHVRRAGAASVKVAVLYRKPHALLKPDYFGATTASWVVFPWEANEFRAAKRKKRRQ